MNWKLLFSDNVLIGSQQYLKKNAIKNFKADSGHIEGDVTGIEDFHVTIDMSDDSIDHMECSCPFSKTGANCKHMAAVLSLWDENKKELNPNIDHIEKTASEIVDTSNEGTSEETRDAVIPVTDIPEPVITMPQESETISKSEPSDDKKNAFSYLVNWPFKDCKNGKISVTADINPVFAFSIYQNGTLLADNISIKNNTEEKFENLVIRIYSDYHFFDMSAYNIGTLEPNDTYTYKGPTFHVYGNTLKKLTEKISCNVFVCVTYGDEEWARYTQEISVLALNQWPGIHYDDVLLASYITPNHPTISNLLYNATKFLEKQTGDSALTGYQLNNPKRVLEMANAAYAAIQMKNITYATAPAGFIEDGQKIRFIDELMAVHMGNCMDMTLLYAACIEEMGLNPILVLVRGHIFAGVWLVDEYFPDTCTRDVAQIEKRIELGELMVVECTDMCAGKSISFDRAMESARNTLAKHEEFESVIDVRRARKGNIKPMPLEKRDGSFAELEHKDRSEDEITGLTKAETERFINEELQSEKITKQIQWEHKLLDLGARNPLINISKNAIPLLAGNLASLEDAFSENAEYKICPIPEEWDIRGVDDFYIREKRNLVGEYAELISQEVKNHRLHTYLIDKDLEKNVSRTYRETKDNMAESGANTLYLVLGELKWTEGKTEKSRYYYAPIVLIPIEIIKKSASAGYIIKGTDEDSQVNVTLLEFLRQKFDLDISGLNPPPTDEHGVDIEKIFGTVRHAILNYKGWDVLENAYIGNFSFAQFVMWNDIHNHPEMLRRSPIVQALMDGDVEWNTYVPSLKQEDEPYLPVSVDDSQLRAINMAVNDVSFVLHGPPGAGKSQTITAMIANAITRGKTVLFVAEKPAALDVVENRLKSIGIGDFCIEIHSNKVKKSHVLDQLKRVKEDFRVLGMKTDYESKMAEIRKARAELDEYGHSLHRKRHYGLSVKELIDEYESIPEQEKKLHFDYEYIKSISQKDVERAVLLMERMVSAGNKLGNPGDSVFKSVGQTEYTMLFKDNLDDALYTYEKSLNALSEEARNFAKEALQSEPLSKLDYISMFSLADAMIKAEAIPEYLMNSDNIDLIESTLLCFIEKRDSLSREKGRFISKYKESILSVDLDGFAKKYADASKKIFGKEKAINAVSQEIEQHTLFSVKQELLSVIENEVENYKKSKEEYLASFAAVPAYVKDKANLTITAEDVIRITAENKNIVSSVEGHLETIKKFKSAGIYENVKKRVQSLYDAKAAFDAAEENVSKLLVMTMPEDATDWIKGKLDFADLVSSNGAELRNWIAFNETRSECLKENLQEICDLYMSGLDGDKVVSVYLRSLYRALLRDALEEDQVLNRFNGNTFNERIAEYKKLEEQLLEITKEEIIYNLSHNLPIGYSAASLSNELKILNKAITSGGRGMSIRELFEKVPNVLRKMCPCFLMSPISVAQYISADSDLFDIVIFDEASQIRTCEAVGALSRGKNAIIVGDPNQMPPTSFFASDSYDEDNFEVEDLDSILDDCLTLGMPETHLEWHYRSRHESLIAFSNRSFYENNMMTFPSVSDRERRVKLCTVNGVFKSGKDRTNEKEAKAIVSEVLRRYDTENLRKYSIGIVTFNQPQQKLIENLLEEEYKQNHEFELWATIGEEPLIVRNLENVQGDERDIILFSVTYGMDEERRWRQDFGPLNKEGGWRRLNVAVSRAKYEMIVFTSITSSMIEDTGKSRGVKGVKSFLEFAANGYIKGEVNQDNTKPKGIVATLCRKLEEQGYSVQRNIGHSKFKIDIAVVNPYDESEYILGIMLDGDTYKASLDNTNDRELSQISILKGLGWHLHRIWTMDWWANSEQIISELLDVLEKRKAEVTGSEGKIKDFDYCPESEPLDPVNTSKKDKSLTERKKRYVRITGMDETNRFTKKIPKVIILENKIYEAPRGDFFKHFNASYISINYSEFDNYATYYVPLKDSEEKVLLLVDEKFIKKYVKKYIDEDALQDAANAFSVYHPEIEEEEIANALADCIEPKDELKRFKVVRAALPRVKYTEDEELLEIVTSEESEDGEEVSDESDTNDSEGED